MANWYHQRLFNVYLFFEVTPQEVVHLGYIWWSGWPIDITKDFSTYTFSLRWPHGKLSTRVISGDLDGQLLLPKSFQRIPFLWGDPTGSCPLGLDLVIWMANGYYQISKWGVRGSGFEDLKFSIVSYDWWRNLVASTCVSDQADNEEWFDWVCFYGISTIVGYLMPNPLYTYLLNISDLVWLGFVAYQPL